MLETREQLGAEQRWQVHAISQWMDSGLDDFQSLPLLLPAHV